VAITGVIARSSMPRAKPAVGVEEALEICPGESLRPCAGVRIEGEPAPELFSVRGGPVVVARVTGRYDGARLTLEGPGERVPAPPEPEYRNPCSAFQDAKRGDVNPSPELAALAEQIEREHPARHAGTFWDRTRQTLTVRLTGDTSELAARLKLASRPDRLCLSGGAAHALQEQLAALEKIVNLLASRHAWFVEGGPDVLTNELALRIENVDRAILDEVHVLAGPGARIERFIELLEGSLGELPDPPSLGDIPLVTQSRRWSYGGMQALGRFRVRLDEAARCVYLETERGERVMPIWPLGYAAHAGPFRVVDFDGVVVVQGPEAHSFGGGLVPFANFEQGPPNRCGASSAWIGAPDRSGLSMPFASSISRKPSSMLASKQTTPFSAQRSRSWASPPGLAIRSRASTSSSSSR
jgi:hypothetical protein